MYWCGLTFELTGPEQGDGICARVFAGTNSGTLCRVRLSEGLGVSALVRGVVASVRSTLAVFVPSFSLALTWRLT